MFSAFASGFVSFRVVWVHPCLYRAFLSRHIYDTAATSWQQLNNRIVLANIADCERHDSGDSDIIQSRFSLCSAVLSTKYVCSRAIQVLASASEK